MATVMRYTTPPSVQEEIKNIFDLKDVKSVSEDWTLEIRGSEARIDIRMFKHISIEQANRLLALMRFSEH